MRPNQKFEKIELKKTYAYRNFIDDEAKQSLLDWVELNYPSFIVNPISKGRKFRKILNEDSIYQLVSTIKNTIIEIEGINDWKKEFRYGDFIGINSEGASIHVHSDYNDGEYIHTRWNLILSYPEDGGHSMYGGEINVLEENLIWKCVAGKYFHGSTEVIGSKPRITLSLGFLIKEN
jgi:hypothetical protein